MAEFLDKDPYSYDQERQAFISELRQFHMRIGSPLVHLPKIAGKELDLYLLYKKVIALGGLAKIHDDEQWEGILQAFKIPINCCHGVFALRSFYVKYLEAYEKIHHQGEDSAEVMAAYKPSVPMGQAHGSNRIPDKLRSSVGLSTAKAHITDYEKIIHSLQSGLPNEIDFAINVCTLLSNEGKHVIHLEKAPKLIDLLLSHVGVFFEGPGSLRMLYEEDWFPTTSRHFVKYWYDTVEDKEVREVIGPEPFKPKGDMDYKEGELFCGRSQGLNDVEEQRITQISIILRNLSFEKHNRRAMAAHRTLYRFLLLCVHNSDSALKQLGIDTLSNLAAEFILDPIDYRSTQLMFHTIDKGMKDPDRLVVLRAMEVLQKLSKVKPNLETIKLCLETRVYHSIVQMLIIHDVQLLLGALEVLLALSQTGEIICTRIAKVDKCIDILVCLITLDAQSLGAEAFIGIKIVDHAPNGIHHPIVTMARYQGPRPPAPAPQKAPVMAQMSVARSSTLQRQDRVATPPPPQQQNSSSTASRAAESENFASQWLHSVFESKPQGSVSRIDLYADYLSACSKMTRGCILNSNSFAACIRNVFPNVGFQRVEQENGAQYHITGIQKRATPLPIRWQNQNQQTPQQQQQVNYHMQVGTNQNTASSIMAHLARKHSPVIAGASARHNFAPGSMQGSPNQFSQSSNMLPNQPQSMATGRPPPGAQVNPPGSVRYQGGLIQTTNPIPQTVLQRPPPSHVQANPILTSPKSSRSRSESPGLNPAAVLQQPSTNPVVSAMSPALSSNASYSPATVIIGGAGGLPTEKCQPPSQIPLPDGEVRIEKVPNLHAQLLQQAQQNAQQQSIHPALPLPLQVQHQQRQGIEVPVAAPSPDNDTLPNPIGLQQQMQQAMQAAKTVSAQPVALPMMTPQQTGIPVASPQQPQAQQQQSNHSTVTPPLPGTTQYIPIQPKPNMSVPSPSPPNMQLQSNQQVGAPAQNQMQVVLINRPAQPSSVQPQQPQTSMPQQQQIGQVQHQLVPQQGTLPNQFPRLASHVPSNAASSTNTDSPLIKRLLQSGTAVQPPVRVSPPTRVSPPQQQVVQPNPAVSMPSNSQWVGPNQPAPQVLPTQGSNHAVPVPATQPTMQSQSVVGHVNNTAIVAQANIMPNNPVQNTVLHRPSLPPPPLPTVNEQLQQHRENQRQLQQQQVVVNNVSTPSSQTSTNCNNGENHVENHNDDISQKTNGPTNPPVLNQESTNGPTATEDKENTVVAPKCNGNSQMHENISKSIDEEEKMEVDPVVKPVSKPVDSLLKQRLVNGYASDTDVPIKNDVVTVGRVEEEVPDKSSGILEAALSIAGIEPDSDERTSSGKSTPIDPMLAGAKGVEPLNHVLNGDILYDKNKAVSPLVADVNSNQGTRTGIVIIGNNGTLQDPNIPKPMVVSAAGANVNKQVNQLILCRDIRENLPANLQILPSNYNNNNQQQQTATVVSAAVTPQMASGSVQLVQAQPGVKQVTQMAQQVQVSNTAVSRNNTVQVQGALITVQQPTGQALQMSRPQGQSVTYQLQQPVGQTVNVQQPTGGVRQLVVATQQQVPVSMQQQTLIVRHVQPQQINTANPTTGQQTMNIQVQNPSGQTGQQVIRLPVSISGGQQQILSVQRPLQQGGQPQTQQSMIIVNMNPNQTSTKTMPAPASVTAIKSSSNLKRPAPANSPKSPKSSKDKLNNTSDRSSSPSHHKEKKKKHSSKKKRRSSSSSSSSSSSHHCSKKKDKEKDKDKAKEKEESRSSTVVCMCEWKGCRRSFSSPKSLHIHASKMHVMGANYRMMCEWDGCDHIQRQKWSCVSHILDKHCSPQAIKASNDRRAKQASGNDTVTGPTQPPIVYNAHNAYHAIRRSLCTPSLKDLLGETEGPVTKSIRLTASLVLKNLATRSSEARRLIRRHEVHLARLAISQAEASTTLSKCIQELNSKS